MVVNITERVVEGDASSDSVGDIDEGIKDFTLYGIKDFRYLEKQNLGMESEGIKILKNILRDITGNGANGRLARGYAPRNVTNGAKSLASADAM